MINVVARLNYFKNGCLKTIIYETKLDLKSLIGIFNKIYNSRIRKVFVAMAFNENGCNDVWAAIKRVYNKLIQEGFELNETEQDEKGSFIPYRVDQVDQFNNNIIKKIEEGIKNCCLMIVDITT